MMKKLTLTTLVLLFAATSTPGISADLPAQEYRIWAPTGDIIGLDTHATAGFTSSDPHGNQEKYAEDWQQNDNFIYNGLFGYQTVLNNSRQIVARGYIDSDGTSTASRFTLTTTVPDRCQVTLDYRSATNFSDLTSEKRSLGFSLPPAPPALENQPALDWRLGKVTFAYDLGKGFGINLGFNQIHKKGNKGSLLRGATASAVPGIKQFDNTTNEFLVGATYRGLNLDLAATGLFRQSENNRTHGDHAFSDDQTYFRAGLEATYRLSSSSSVLGAVSSGKLKAENTESWISDAYSPHGESKTMNGRLAFITRIGSATTARLTAGFGTWNTDHQTDLAGIMEQATSRERSSTDAGLLITNTSLKKTRLRFDYRFRATKLEDNVAMENLDNQTIDQDRLSQRISLRSTSRLGRKTTMRASLDWRYLTVDQTNAWVGNELFYTMGDRTQNRLGGRLAIQTRPNNKTRLDLGVKFHSQNFERDEAEGIKTTNSATQGFIGLNILASDRLTFVGSGSYGMEKYEIENGPVAGSGMGPLTYEGKTLRFAPGAIYQAMEKLQLEAHYEGVRFEDPGDAPDDGNQLNSDLTRILARASYQVGSTMKVTATYRRHEFDENRWDDYIMDLYSLSLSGTF